MIKKADFCKKEQTFGSEIFAFSKIILSEIVWEGFFKSQFDPKTAFFA